jgi:two-component system OmpR family sensor kinase
MMSIRRSLLIWLLSSVLAGGIGAAFVVFVQARIEVNDIFDYQLRQLALTLRDRTFFPNDFTDALTGEEALDFVIQVWATDGTLLYVSPTHIKVPNAVQLGFGEVTAQNGHWRTYATQQRGLIIQVAQPLSVRNRLAFTAAWRTLLPFVVALPLMGLLIWRLVGRELKPIETAAQAVARRSPQSLAPIETEKVPVEIEPLVLALNGLLGRLSGALEHERQFIADAAHELRTPLTALRLQLQLAERARDDEERARSHAALRDGIARAVRLVEQLLALARQDPDVPVEARAVDLVPVARSALDGHAASAQARGLSLGLEAPDDPVCVRGDPASLRTLLDNLLDNAMRYTPSGGVEVRVAREDSRAILEVEDTGPGIPPSERTRVFDRFYRGEGAAAGGSGLGLPIVQRIADKHGGSVELLDAASGHGLRVRVSLPSLPETGAAAPFGP